MTEKSRLGYVTSLTCGVIFACMMSEFVWAQDNTLHDGSGTSTQTQEGIMLIRQYLESLHDRDSDVRRKAAGALRRMGPNGRGAALALLAALNDEDKDVRYQASRALLEMRFWTKEIVDGLRIAIRHQDEQVRVHAVLALSEAGHLAIAAVPDLLDALPGSLTDQSWVGVSPDFYSFTIALARAIVKLSAEKDTVRSEAVARLLVGTEHEDPRVRRRASDGLAELGVGTPDVVTALSRLIADRSVEVRYSAARTLARVRPPAVAAIGALNRVLADTATFTIEGDEYSLASVASQALTSIGAQALPVLIESLRDERAIVREHAAWALCGMGSVAHPALGALRYAARDSDVRVRYAAKQAVERLTPTAHQSPH